VRRGPRLSGSVLALCLAFVPFASPRASAEDAECPTDRVQRGPIPVRNGRPYQLLFLQFLPEGLDLLPVGKTGHALQLDVFNNLLIPGPTGGVVVVEDNETQRLLFTWRRGLAGKSEVALFVPMLWRNSGFIDELIRGWHHLFGLGGNPSDYDPTGRDARPSYKSTLYLTDPTGRPVIRGKNAFGLGDVSFTGKRLLLSSPRAALAIRGGFKLPTGNPGQYLGSGGVDIGLMADGRYNFGRDVILFGGFGGILMGGAARVPNARHAMAQYLLAVEYRPNSRDSYVAQLDGNDAAVRTGNRVADRTHTTLTLGYQRVLDRRHLLYASFSENGDWMGLRFGTPYLGGVGPDFTATVGLKWNP
jgi:hypothetical protein